MEHEILNLRRKVQEAEKRAAAERATADKVVADMRSAGADLTAPENFEKVDAAYKGADAARDEIVSLRSQLDRFMELAGQKAAEASEGSIEQRDNAALTRLAAGIGDTFLRSAEYAALKRSGVLEMSQARVNTNPVEATTRDQAKEMLRTRALIDNTSGSGGGLIWSDRTGIVVPAPVRPIQLLDLITIGDTDSDTVEFARENAPVDNAAETAYNVLAPESAYGWVKDSTTVRRIPHFVPATKGSLADGGQLRTLLDARLVRGVRLRVEAQVANGNGTGENLRGILNTPGIGTVARGTDTRMDAIHKAITNVRTNTYQEPFAVGMSPTDFESLVLEKEGGTGQYLLTRSDREPTTLWGLQPVVSPLFASGTPVVGNFADAILWVRAGISVAATDSHADFFLRGLVAILAEMRAAFTVLEPRSFCRVTGF